MSVLRKLLSISLLLLFGILLAGCDKTTSEVYLDKIESITIHFDTNSDTVINSITINQDLIDSIDVDKIADVELSDLDFLTPVKTGYVFENWYFDKELTDELSVNSPIIEEYLKLFEEEDSITLNITLYAEWSEVQSTNTNSSITYHLDGGINHIDNPATFSSDDTVTLLNPTKDGFIFEGWFSDNTFNTEISGLLTDTKVDLELWAKWLDVSMLTFEKEGDAYIVTGCDTDYAGIITIPDTYQGLPVTKIDEGAFLACEEITEVILGINITHIGDSAFWACDKLETINIHDGVVHIGYQAFQSCDSLANVTIGNGVTYIGAFAFSGCDSLQTIVLGANVIELGRQAFSHSGLTSITLNNKLEIMGDYVFMECSSLVTITIPSSVTYVGDYAFGNCEGLIIHVLQDSIPEAWHSNWNSSKCQVLLNGESLPDTYTVSYELDGGSNNSSNPISFVEGSMVTLENPVKEGYIFLGWYTDASFTSPITSLNSTINSDLTLYASWEESIAPSYLTYEVFDDYVAITGMTDDRAEIEIPESYMGLPVTTIAENAFYWKQNLTTVVLPESITTIETGAFWASSLSNINFPESLRTIGDYAFAQCNFTTITLPDTIESYGIEVFINNSELETVILPDNMVVIRERFFEDCDKLVSINIPATVEEIEEAAFAGCLSLENIDLTNVRFIGKNAFSNCSSFTRIELSNKLTVINEYAFSSNQNVTEVILPDNLEIIGDGAFSGSYSLKSIDFPLSLEFIGDSAFWGCSLTNLVLPNSLLVIGEHAFRYNDFSTVYLPGTLEIVGDLAFRDCENLFEIYISGRIDKMGERVFRDVKYSGTIYVDGGESHSGWAPEWLDNFYGTIKYNEAFHTINISYVLNDGVNHEGNVSSLGINYNLVLQDPTRDGYHFKGWYTDDTLTEEITVIPQATLENQVLYAKWEAEADNEYSIIYHLDGGSNFSDTPQYFVAGSVTTLIEPTKAGSIFMGWYTDSDFTNEITIITSDTTNDLELYAKWEEDYILYEEFDDYVAVTGLKYQLLHVEIPSTYNGKPVTTIAESSLTYNTIVLELVLPSSITTIEKYAISLDHLRYLELAEGLLTIGDYGIQGCNDLKEIIIPSTVTSIGKGAFYSNNSLKNIVFNNSMTIITESMFEDCFSLETIVIPEGVTRIEKNAFDDCELLSNITLPSTLTYIDKFAFARTTSLTEIILPESLLEIGEKAFYESGLVNLTIPDAVTTIGEDLFSYSRDLETLTIGASVTTILGYHDFTQLESLKAIYVSENNELYDSFDGVLYANYDDYTLLKFPVNNIHRTYDVVEGTVVIARDAFTDSNITTISFPDSLTTINEYAFNSCSKLSSIYLPETILFINGSIFSSYGHINIFVEHETRPDDWNSNFENTDNTVYWNLDKSDIKLYLDVMEYIIVDDHIEITKFYPQYEGGYILDLDIPNYIDGIPVTTINSYAFVDISGKIIIPNTITTILEKAFYNTTVKIYCEASSIPDGWHGNWKYYSATVQWNIIYFKMDAQGGTYDFPIIGTTDNLSYIGRGWTPYKEGYDFVGWYKNPECTDGNEWTFTQLPADPDKQPSVTTTIYAKWEVAE